MTITVGGFRTQDGFRSGQILSEGSGSCDGRHPLRSSVVDKLLFGLCICVSIGYTGAMKDVGLRIRVQRGLRDQFLEVCRAQDKPAAQVLREFMRNYVAAHPECPPNSDARDGLSPPGEEAEGGMTKQGRRPTIGGKGRERARR